MDRQMLGRMSLERQFNLAADIRAVENLSHAQCKQALRTALEQLAQVHHMADCLLKQAQFARQLMATPKLADQEGDREKAMPLAREMRAKLGIPPEMDE
jgi:hypothetical protein